MNMKTKSTDSPKDKIIKKMVAERIVDATNYLKGAEKELSILRKKRREFPDAEMIGGVQHQIGYMTGLKYELEQVQELLNMSYEEILEMIEENKRIDAHNKKTMKEIMNRVKTDSKNKAKNLKLGKKNGK